MPPFRRNAPANPSIGDQINQKLTFFGMVGVVMTALKLKDRWDDYRQLPEDEEGAVRLPSSPNTQARELVGGDDDISMLDTQIPRPKRVRRKGCCMCCGIDCTIFWKAIGIVMLLFTIWNGFKLIKWALTPTPTGLEGMPEFSSSLGCSSAPHLFEGSKATYTIPVASADSKHALTLRGAAVGTLTLADAAVGATDITLNITVRTDDKSLLQGVSVDVSKPDQATVSTPIFVDAHKACMRFDATLYVPSNLKSLELSALAVTQIKFNPNTHITLDDLSVNMLGMDERNMLQTSESVKATNIAISSSRGWIIGDVALVNSTSISTAKGDCVANVHVHPSAPIQQTTPEPAFLTTTHGSGRADFFYENDGAHAHRPIVSTHSSSRGGDLYLTYKNAEYSGTIDIKSKSHTAYGMQGSVAALPGQVGKSLPWAGDVNGGDKLVINSPRGWVGLYF